MSAFEDFYGAYPRKKARGDAEKAFGQALKKGHTVEDIMNGLARNLADLSRRDPQFVPYPASWLRAESYWDEPDQTTNRNGRRTIRDAANDYNASHGYLSDAFGLPSLNRH